MNSSKNEEWHIIILMMMIITINTNTDKYFSRTGINRWKKTRNRNLQYGPNKRG